jgi:alkylhydroperoxidase family enzyme
VKRIPDPAPGELRADVEELLPLIASPGGKPAATMVVMARSPDLLAPFLGWAAALALNGVLSSRDHELLALRAAYNCGSKFEWDEHSEFARGAGRADSEIAASPAILPLVIGRRPMPRCCGRPSRARNSVHSTSGFSKE